MNLISAVETLRLLYMAEQQKKEAVSINAEELPFLGVFCDY